MQQSHPQAVVRARGLTKHFGDRVAVKSIDLDIPPGGCFGLLGPNGAGKTTTLRMILGQSPITAGTLEVLGLPLPAGVREIRRRTGVVPQMDNADPDFTVYENLRTYARYFDVPRAIVGPRIAELLATKSVFNEFLAYEMLNADVADIALTERGKTIATYALCGFANPGSLGIMIGAISGLIPERRAEVAGLSVKAFVGGTLAAFMTACVAGVLT